MILGIDFGLSYIGLAISEGVLADPYGTVKFTKEENVIKEIEEICKKLNVETLIIGVSEGTSGQNALNFGNKLSDMLRLPVKFVDETLTTLEADSGKRKDKDKIHERSAALILQRYLDNN